MKPIENTRDRYGALAVLFHWVIAILVIALAALGLYMVRLPDAGFDKEKIRLILLHKEVGVIVLFLVALRFAWRMSNVIPRLVENLPDWQKLAARFVHLSFYGLLVALPVSGWLMSSASGIPVSVLGWFVLPDLIPHDEQRFREFIEIHKWLGYLLIVLIFIHMGAALRHHFMLRDDTLRRMLA